MQNDKKQILIMVKDIFNRWEELLGGMSEEQVTDPWLPGGWSVKDVLAHLRAWQQRSIARLEAARLSDAKQNKEPEFPKWPEHLDPNSEDDTSHINAWIYDTNRERPWLSVYEDWRDGFLRFMELGAAIPDEDLLTAGRYPWLPNYPLAFILTASVEHHQEHYDLLRGWIALRRDTLDLFEDHSDVGTVQPPGSYEYDPEQQIYTITSAGSNIWGDHDDFHFVWRRMRGDFILTARAGFIGAGANAHRKLGWMARASLQADSPAVSAAVHGDGLVSLQFRHTQGGQTEEVKAPLNGADVVQLERKGSTYLLSAARYGDPFTTVQAGEIDLGEEVYVGLYVCSHEEAVAEQATFQNVGVVVPVKEGFNRERDPFGSRLEILNVESGQRQLIYSRDDVFEAPNWTRDGKALIFNSHGRLFRFDLDTRSLEPIDTGDVVRNNNDHVLSFDGKMLAISSDAGAPFYSLVYTVPLEGGQPKQITPSGPSYLHGWSPDGQYLVYTGLRGGDFDIYRIPALGGEETRLTTAPGLDDGPEYTPDGRYIYFNSVRSGRMQIWRMRPDGSGQEQLTDDEYNNWFPHISPDGKWVIFVTYLVGEVEPSDHPAAKRVYLRVMPLDGGEPKVVAYLYGGQGTMNVPSWSPDGKKVAFVSNTVPF